ncbi:oxidoreductase [Gigaspora rosea]|uniref:3-dehydrosphinganine reductase n=1 Tax=Gigaspora rosea TaxID=44941 RepID=A0A397USW1_9GLOM|nr:oxidoreductase [Gigaspora rosea]
MIFILLLGNSLFTEILKRDKFCPKGKHVYITGGSSGLGKEIAKLMASKGAHAARSREDHENLKFTAIFADLTDYDESIRALNEASSKHNGRVPEIIFCCAGFSLPRIFIEQPIKEFEKTMQLNYFGTLYTVHEAVKRMAQQNVKGKIVLVSSLLGLCGFIGYSSYAPTKHAIKGLVECLRNELILYGISVHGYFAGTIDTPGYHEEMKIKPKVTHDIEGDSKVTSEHAAKSLYNGLCKGNVFITTDIVGDAIRASSLGISQANNAFYDAILCFIAWVG